jgi:hypothetical protein
MAQAWAAGIGALLLVVTASGAFVQTDLAVRRHHDGGCSIGIAFGGGCLRFRQAHRSFRGKSEGWQQGYRQNTQQKAHDSISLFRSYCSTVVRIMLDPTNTSALIISGHFLMSAFP